MPGSIAQSTARKVRSVQGSAPTAVEINRNNNSNGVEMRTLATLVAKKSKGKTDKGSKNGVRG